MSEVIISAMLSAGAAIIVSYIQHNKTTALIEYRLDELTKKVEKHNNLVERFSVLEQSVNTAWKRIDEIKEEIDKLR